MTPASASALCAAVAQRELGELGNLLGEGMAQHLAPAQITTALRIAHWMAQVAHETGGFQWLVELGGPEYFHKYDGRRDLGNTLPGDGYRFRGRGLIQLTGRANYTLYGKETGIDLLGDPDLAAEPANAVWTAVLYWDAHNLNQCADADDIVTITRRINGGLNGIDDRKAMLARAKRYIADNPL